MWIFSVVLRINDVEVLSTVQFGSEVIPRVYGFAGSFYGSAEGSFYGSVRFSGDSTGLQRVFYEFCDGR